MPTDVNTIEWFIEYLRERTSPHISTVLASSEFERGRESRLYDLITEFEYMLLNANREDSDDEL